MSFFAADFSECVFFAQQEVSFCDLINLKLKLKKLEVSFGLRFLFEITPINPSESIDSLAIAP